MRPLEFLLSSNTGVRSPGDWRAEFGIGKPARWATDQMLEAKQCWLDPDENRVKQEQLMRATIAGDSGTRDTGNFLEYHLPSLSFWRLLKHRSHPEVLSLSQSAWQGLKAFDDAYQSSRSKPVTPPTEIPALYSDALTHVLANIVRVPHERHVVFQEIGPTDLALALVNADPTLLEAFGGDLSPFACRLFFETWEAGKLADQPILSRARFEVGETLKKLFGQGSILALPPEAYELDGAVVGELRPSMLRLWESLEPNSLSMALREYSSEWLVSMSLLFPELSDQFPVPKSPSVSKPFLQHLDEVKSMISVLHHLFATGSIDLSLPQERALQHLCDFFELSPPEVTP